MEIIKSDKQGRTRYGREYREQALESFANSSQSERGRSRKTVGVRVWGQSLEFAFGGRRWSQWRWASGHLLHCCLSGGNAVSERNTPFHRAPELGSD